MDTTTIGELIEKEVRKQGWKMEDFADAICRTRVNVYDIFKRKSLDTAQLALISKVLKHNFFEDIISNPNLIDVEDPDIKKRLHDKKALAQFMEVLPRVMERLKWNTCLMRELLTLDMPLPEFGLTEPVSFTVGDWLVERFERPNPLIQFHTETSPTGIRVDFFKLLISNSVAVNVKIDYKTEEEWEAVMRYVKDECLPKTRLNFIFSQP